MLSRVLTISIISLAISIVGCTNTKAIIAEKEAQIASKNEVINQKNNEIASLNTRLSTCEDELAQTKKQCGQQLSEMELESEKLLIREQELKARLANDIELKNVEIERLRGQLTIKVLDKILFRSGSIVILPEGKAVLTRVAESLAGSEENLRVEGHTDDVPIGSVLVERIPSNWELSVLRATSVVKFLEKNKIESGRLSATGHSEFKPVVENNSEENRQLNRRVEIVLLPK